MNTFESLDLESCSKSEIYLYEQDGKWYAYRRSAKELEKLSAAALKLKEVCSFMLDKVEVDLERLLAMNWFVALCSDNEMMLLKNG